MYTHLIQIHKKHLRGRMAHTSALKLFCAAAFLLGIIVTGNGQGCQLSSVQVLQTNTGLKAGYDAVFEVEVKNLCHCTVSNVMLSSQGFSSSMPVDPKLFRRQSNGYIVNDGNGIHSLSSVKFRYAWDHYFRMAPAGFQMVC